jgi:hypothetical protein
MKGPAHYKNPQRNEPLFQRPTDKFKVRMIVSKSVSKPVHKSRVKLQEKI